MIIPPYQFSLSLVISLISCSKSLRTDFMWLKIRKPRISYPFTTAIAPWLFRLSVIRVPYQIMLLNILRLSTDTPTTSSQSIQDYPIVHFSPKRHSKFRTIISVGEDEINGIHASPIDMIASDNIISIDNNPVDRKPSTVSSTDSGYLGSSSSCARSREGSTVSSTITVDRLTVRRRRDSGVEEEDENSDDTTSASEGSFSSITSTASRILSRAADCLVLMTQRNGWSYGEY